jgi:Protein kinase domain
MCSSYSEFYQTDLISDTKYAILAALDPETLELVALDGENTNKLVFLVMLDENNIMAVHRLQRYAHHDDLDSSIVAFCGDVSSLVCLTLPEDVFQFSDGDAKSIDQLQEEAISATEAEAILSASDAGAGNVEKAAGVTDPPEAMKGKFGIAEATVERGGDRTLPRPSVDSAKTERLMVPHAILVPPQHVDRVLNARLTPRELWRGVIKRILDENKEETYKHFVNWARRALTDSEGIMKVVAAAAVGLHENWTGSRLSRDLPGYVPNRFPFLHQYEIHHCPLRPALATMLVNVMRVPSASHDFMDDLEKREIGLISEGKIDATNLTTRVMAVRGSPSWATHALTLAYERPELASEVPSELFLLQNVFSPISCLMYSLCPSHFCSATPLRTAHVLANGLPVSIKPVSGIKASSKRFYVLGMMELEDKFDRIKSVLFTFMSALAIRQAGLEKSITIPFVMCNGTTAKLYVTVLNENCDIPIVRFVCETSMDAVTGTVFLAHLVVLMCQIVEDVLGGDPQEVGTKLDALTPVDGPSYDFGYLETQPPDQQPHRRTSHSTEALATGHSANRNFMQVISCFGEVGWLEYPPCLQRWYVFDEEAVTSPSCRFGILFDDDVGRDLAVFIKAWRDEGSHRGRIKSEIRLLKMAYQAGVPCPKVVDHLTALDIDFEGEVYHRLVMTRLVNGRVERQDLVAFAKSLIKAVVTLHQAGVLHCDIKPENVVWDKVNKVVSLVDFGHAQEEQGALAYKGTDGFTDPQVKSESEPHSRLSDRYSVGETLKRIVQHERDSKQAPTNPCRVQLLAEALSCEDRTQRLTLEEAFRSWVPMLV